jgi:Spy/CpxP family protein refolding chaperone
MRHTFLAIVALLLTASLPAQQDDRVAAARADSAAIVSPERRQLERRLHDRMLDVVRDRLNLTQEQVDKLGVTNQHYEQQRRTLAQRERSLRLELRAQLRRSDSADQKRVGELLDQTMQAQQARLDLYRKEQSDLSAFLTPVQRAKYMGLQEQMRSRVDELRHKRGDRNRRPMQGKASPAQGKPDTSSHRL